MAVWTVVQGQLNVEATFDAGWIKKGDIVPHNFPSGGDFVVGTEAEIRQIGLNSTRKASHFKDRPQNKVIAVEDAYAELDRDYDDWWWEVGVQEKMDLVLQNLPEEHESDRSEITVGGYIGLNDDDDNENGVADFEESGAIAGEDNLVPLTLFLPSSIRNDLGAQVTLSLSGANSVRVWGNANRQGDVILGGAKTSITWLRQETPTTLWIEGVVPSGAERDIEFTLSATPSHPLAVAPEPDQVRATVVQVRIRSSFPPYQGAQSLHNLLAAWPDGPGWGIGEPLPLNVSMTPDVQEIPGGWKWQVTHAVSSPPDDAVEIHVNKLHPGMAFVDLMVPILGPVSKHFIEPITIHNRHGGWHV